jgi:DNA/RNA-binding domain of Phe-tRNA-synthetase-like protein
VEKSGKALCRSDKCGHPDDPGCSTEAQRAGPEYPLPEKLSDMHIDVNAHSALRTAAFTTTFARPLGEHDSPHTGLLRDDASAPLRRDEPLRHAVRDMLRHGGYKPTGRGKPASEYLVRAAADGVLSSINAAVDACNAVSLHSGFPISVVDLDRLATPLRIVEAPAGTAYVFNPAGHVIDVAGLPCLFDSDGACANAVRDSQRTKTSAATVRTLSVIWGPAGFEDRMAAAQAWYRALLGSAGGETCTVQLIEPVR